MRAHGSLEGPVAVLGLVQSFHRACGLPYELVTPLLPSADVVQRRHQMLLEEMDELQAAAGQRDLEGYADALADLVYLAYGNALLAGIDLDGVIEEVHISNMSKREANGRIALDANGKALKPAHWQPPDLSRRLSTERTAGTGYDAG